MIFSCALSMVIPLRTLLIGLGKTPVFAMLIAAIGCYEGMRVHGSADSVGQQTTRSVVLAIFFIIVADAIFSIIFSKDGFMMTTDDNIIEVTNLSTYLGDTWVNKNLNLTVKRGEIPCNCGWEWRG